LVADTRRLFRPVFVLVSDTFYQAWRGKQLKVLR
jgi:hypothetical protein